MAVHALVQVYTGAVAGAAIGGVIGGVLLTAAIAGVIALVVLCRAKRRGTTKFELVLSLCIYIRTFTYGIYKYTYSSTQVECAYMYST